MSRRNVLRSLTSAVGVVSLCAAALVGAATSAAAAPAPVVPVPASAVSADALPTVQVNGVVWSQAVVGNTVYAAGSFSTARPAGSAPGTNTVARSNLLAYDITTGALITTFAPSVNAQILSVAASPDGSRIYVAGDFTAINGQARRRVAAFDTATGALSTAFNPTGVNSQARAVIATADSVYVGGGFAGLGNGQLRNNLAAFRASDGAVLPWNPNADYTVWAIAVSGDGQWVFAGGSFQNVGGQSAIGLAKINGASGALDPSWDPAVNNRGPDTGISSLRVQGSFVYGTSWSFGNGANLEGAFKLPITNSTLEWVTACHGDNYSVFMMGGVVYTAGHEHYCGAMGGGFPQYPQWRFQHSVAWTDAVGGEILNDSLGYPNWHGVANAPSMVAWDPDMTMGSYTGQYQAGWNIAGNNDYVVYGGEFPTVNGVGQQGLVRFARRGLAPNREGPRFTGGTFVPRLVATSSSTVRVSWTAGYDRDDYTLTYKVIRNGATGSPRFTTTASSSWWSLPAVGFVDTGLTPGATYTYQLVANDPSGNTVFGASASITMPTSSSPSNGYAQSVRANGARIYWPMNETSGLTVNDRAAGTAASSGIGVTDGRGDTGISWNQSGAIAGDTAAALTANDFSRVYALGSETAPDTFTIQAWVRTTTGQGGRIFGFGDLQNGASAHRDRHLYMDNGGHIVFGVRAQNNQARTLVSPSAYNNGQWHMLTATMSSAGMRLYVDGNLVGSRTDTTAGEAYLGYWRVGGDVLDTSNGRPGWSPLPSTVNFVGSVDEFAFYPTALAQSTIQAQYALRNGGGGGNQPPTASFTWGTTALAASFDGSGSSDPDGSVTGYSWNFGDGATGTGVAPSHTYAAAGTYTVQLTVTDNQGATGTTTRQVTVAAAGVIANDLFNRTVVDGWGQADTGGTWTLTTAASNFAVGSGVGTIRLAASSGPSAYLTATSARDVDLRTTVGFDKPATGGGVYTSAVVRRVGTSDYRLKVRVTGTDTTAYLARTVGGVETVLTTVPLPGVVVAGGDALSLRVQAVGGGTTTLNAKVWRAGTAEPGGWTTTTTDSTSGLQSAGAVGLYTYLSASATNAPITLSFPDLSAVAP
jgi:PKD repeat protein